MGNDFYRRCQCSPYSTEDDKIMSYLTGSIQLNRFKYWLYFAVGNIIINGGIFINGADLMNKLKEIWPTAEINTEMAAAGIIFAFLAGILVIMFRIQIFVEILQTADFAAVLYAFYSFKPSIIGIPSGTIIFTIVVVLFLVGYIVSQLPFAKMIYINGTICDKIFFLIIFLCSVVLFIAPGYVLSIN
jgi:hypothetical protein